MIQITYKGYAEPADLGGLSVAEARQQLSGKFGIPNKAVAELNGKRLPASLEARTYLSNDDQLSFTEVSRRRALIVAGAISLALVLICGVFAYGFINGTAKHAVSSAVADFASVTEITSTRPVIKTFGSFKGSMGAGDLFTIVPAADFPGNLVATVSLANVDRLVKCYRVMALLIEARDSADTLVDINLDSYKNGDDYALLTLNSGTVDLCLPGSDNYTIRLKGGYYVSHMYSSSWSSGEASPVIYCNIGQR